MMSSGKRSRRVDNIWPNLIKMGPRASSDKRKRSPRDNLGTGFRREGDSLNSNDSVVGACS